ncbi:hypothetical protein KSD_22430 [Ktedonobacter sp. SOSP1-85]|uniref:hypothetical protein n=1 Tax=Ktedonobacter sp. SOSP1-85 TaxID=2778367 RepID=UPI001914EEC8|nr:hypothetical protein [Ktedonobacter sp. SOSP1-85]GHO74472.1 hypothetical protein KSD_22430 [Ktedonobacter sp. SOSP1-85]
MTRGTTFVRSIAQIDPYGCDNGHIRENSPSLINGVLFRLPGDLQRFVNRKGLAANDPFSLAVGASTPPARSQIISMLSIFFFGNYL